MLDGLSEAEGRGLFTFLRLPTLFLFDASDAAFRIGGYVGLVLSLCLLCGLANVPLLFTLWFLYLSYVHVGRTFYGYGWEILLLETGFLAIFLAPTLHGGPFARRTPPSPIVIWLLRWLLFRLMFGAGLIKLRGDPCWRDLTCMFFHYETQPVPNPLSWYFHHLPLWFHRVEVVFNHLVELIAPLFVFGPRRARHVAGAAIVAFQVLLILSGNLSFLNWLTIAVAVACFDDGFLGRLLPARARAGIEARTAGAEESKARALAVYALALVVGLLSINPVVNMLSPRQVMNTSFDPLRAREHVRGVRKHRARAVRDRARRDGDAQPESARWTEYQFKCKPGDPSRRPCWVSPYHYRLDWQMWFAAMPGAGTPRWLVQLVAKLLAGDGPARGLLAPGPFDDRPPRWIRGRLYRYEFTHPGDRDWWRRTFVAEYLPPLSTTSPALQEYLEQTPEW